MSVENPGDFNLWTKLAEQTPPIFRWVFTVLTLGIGTLFAALYKAHKKEIREMDQRQTERVDVMERRYAEWLREIENRQSQGISEIRQRLEKQSESIGAEFAAMNRAIFALARDNGGRRHSTRDPEDRKDG